MGQLVAKTLPVVALATLAILRVAVAASISEDVFPSLKASRLLIVAPSPGVVKAERNVRSDLSTTSEERAVPSVLAAKLETWWPGITLKLPQSLRRTIVYSDLTRLKLHKSGIDHPKLFDEWVASIKSKFPGHADAQYRAATRALDRQYKADSVARILVLAKSSSNLDFVKNLLTRQTWRWNKAGFSEDTVFTLLQLPKDDTLLDNPFVWIWLEYALRKIDDKSVSEQIKVFETYLQKDVKVAEMLFKAPKHDVRGKFMSQLRTELIDSWIRNDVNYESLQQKLGEADVGEKEANEIASLYMSRAPQRLRESDVSSEVPPAQ